MNVAEKEETINLAKLAEQTRRFDDMIEQMTKIVEGLDRDALSLTVEERALLVRGYRHAISMRRCSLQRLSIDERAAVHVRTNGERELLTSYREKILCELKALCAGVVDLVDCVLLPTAMNEASTAACCTLKGDQLRYVAEATHEAGERAEFAQAATHAYSEALEVGKELPGAHPAILAASLNFALLCGQVLRSPNSAKNIAQRAIHEAASSMHLLREEERRDASSIITAIQDYIVSWKTDDDSESSENSLLSDDEKSSS